MHSDHDEPGTDALFVTDSYPDTLFHDNAFAHGDAYVVPDADTHDAGTDNVFTITNAHGDIVLTISESDSDPIGGEQLHSAAVGVRLPRRHEHRRSSRYPTHRR